MLWFIKSRWGYMWVDKSIAKNEILKFHTDIYYKANTEIFSCNSRISELNFFIKKIRGRLTHSLRAIHVNFTATLRAKVFQCAKLISVNGI